MFRYGTVGVENGLKAVFHYVRFARAGRAGFESRKFFNSQGEITMHAPPARAKRT